MSRIRGTAMWASLAKPNKMSGKLQIDVCNLGKEARETLKADGITVKHEPTVEKDSLQPRNHYVTVKGNPDYPPKLVDAKKNPLPLSTGVGNGSEVVVVYKPYDWTFQGKKGVGAGLRVVQVVKLVEFSGGTEELDEEEGFTYEGDSAVSELGDGDEDGTDDANLDDEIPF